MEWSGFYENVHRLVYVNYEPFVAVPTLLSVCVPSEDFMRQDGNQLQFFAAYSLPA